MAVIEGVRRPMNGGTPITGIVGGFAGIARNVKDCPCLIYCQGYKKKPR